MLISVMAGNSDNKLTQGEWSNFVNELSNFLSSWQVARHFFGGSPTWAAWQNVCFVIEIRELEQPLLDGLTSIREKYRQDSVCILVGDAQFI